MHDPQDPPVVTQLDGAHRPIATALQAYNMAMRFTMPYQKTMSPPEVDLSPGHFGLMFELRDVTTGRDQTKQTYISDTESRASLWHRLSVR
ncbi:uncharacterized protein RCO7_14844 [Rhynchosporium graminicola]|uniref:Uncharacterized protein n=1 Tax=Rhynchosporium graminicola TaxID=2792576 RepID=A0A1E1L5N5_9HELO|nr:uncharacterized protein RCO7_14844 [Rhynchosporium commune]